MNVPIKILIKEPMKNQPFPKRLSYSLQGIRTAWRLEASFRFQSMMALAVVGLLLGLRPAAIWWALLLLNCGLVLAAELFNTALNTPSTTCTRNSTQPSRCPRTAPPGPCSSSASAPY